MRVFLLLKYDAFGGALSTEEMSNVSTDLRASLSKPQLLQMLQTSLVCPQQQSSLWFLTASFMCRVSNWVRRFFCRHKQTNSSSHARNSFKPLILKYRGQKRVYILRVWHYRFFFSRNYFRRQELFILTLSSSNCSENGNHFFWKKKKDLSKIPPAVLQKRLLRVRPTDCRHTRRPTHSSERSTSPNPYRYNSISLSSLTLLIVFSILRELPVICRWLVCFSSWTISIARCSLQRERFRSSKSFLLQ